MDPFFLPKALGFCLDPPVERVQPAWWAHNNVNAKNSSGSSSFSGIWCCTCKGNRNTSWGNWLDRLLFACWAVQQPAEQPALLHECAFAGKVASPPSGTPLYAVPPSKLVPLSPMSWRQRFWLLQQQHMLQLRHQEHELYSQKCVQIPHPQRQLLPPTRRTTTSELRYPAQNASLRDGSKGTHTAASCQHSNIGHGHSTYGVVRAPFAPEGSIRRLTPSLHSNARNAIRTVSRARTANSTEPAAGPTVRTSPHQGLCITLGQHLTALPTPVPNPTNTRRLCSTCAARQSPDIVHHPVVWQQAPSAPCLRGGAAPSTTKIVVVEQGRTPLSHIYLPSPTTYSDWLSPGRSNATDVSGLSTATTRVSSSENSFLQSSRPPSVILANKNA